MRGREAEWGLVKGVLLRPGDEPGGVILVEGEPGIGKSLLLAEARRAAEAAGCSVVTAVADELQRRVPLWPLRAALHEPIDVPLSEPHHCDEPDARMRLIHTVHERLEKLTAVTPVLLTVDDMQHADPITIMALRLLPQRLAARPLVWMLAGVIERGPVARLFDLLDAEGAVRIRLGGLPGTAIAAQVADLLGADPDDALLSLAEGIGGNPFMVGQLLRGLDEENALSIADGRATLLSDRVPVRIQRLIQDKLDMLHAKTKQLLETAAVLGRSFALEDAADMLDEPPAAMLPAVNEALAAGILVADGEQLSFGHVLVWRAVADAMPESVTRALQHQFGEILLDRGTSALGAAGYLLKGARRGDRRTLDGLDQAVREVLRLSPRTAADLAMRALDLTDQADPARVDRSLAAVNALVAARRLREASDLIRATLAGPLLPVPRSRLRCALASLLAMTGQPNRACAEVESVLSEPYLPDSVRDEATVVLLQAQTQLTDLREAKETASGILAAPERNGVSVMAAALAVLATVRWNEGRVAESLELSHRAVSGPSGIQVPGSPPFQARLDLAARLVSICHFDEVTALIGAPPADISPVGLAEAQARPALLRARMHLAAGRLDDARSEARAALGSDPADGPWPYTTLSQYILGIIALRRGDLHDAGRCLEEITSLPRGARSGRIGIYGDILGAHVAETRHGPAQALRFALRIYDNTSQYRWLLLHDLATAPWLVRLALAVGDRERAERAGAVAGTLGQANPAFPAVTATAAHTRGLLGRDADGLRTAFQTQPDQWARASAGEDLAVLLAGTGKTEDAIAYLEQALDGYEKSGATWDAARIHRRLRVLGVPRRQRRTAKRQVRGWESLTEVERNVAVLVSQGLTNRRIADQMYVSVNTVAFHVRRIFSKMSVTSRVELARLVLEQRTDPDPPDASGPASA